MLQEQSSLGEPRGNSGQRWQVGGSICIKARISYFLSFIFTHIIVINFFFYFQYYNTEWNIFVSFYKSPSDMEFVWLYSLCQCTLCVSVIVVSVRLCMAVTGKGSAVDVQEQSQIARSQPGSVSCCLRMCLGCVGAIGGAVGVPVNVLLNLRSPQCLYTCITLVCSPLLVRQFTMFLLVLLTLDAHLHHHLADRWVEQFNQQREKTWKSLTLYTAFMEIIRISKFQH